MHPFSPKEIEGMETRQNLLVEKRLKLQEALDLATDASVQFKLEKQIEEISFNLQDLYDQLSKAYCLHSSSGGDFFFQKIQEINLSIEEMGEEDLVNVNRRKEVDYFFEQFDTLIDTNFQFYFISSCATQMPTSFSERTIFDIVAEELDDQLSAIKYERKADSNRIRIRDLPIGRNLKNSKQAFKKYFAEFFQCKEHVTLEQFIETGLPNLKYEYVAFVFDYDMTEWKPFHQEYFQWLFDTFQHTDENMPTFLFFFVLTSSQLHQKRAEEYRKDAMIAGLEELVAANDSATHISPLRPVTVEDIRSWFRKLKERNPGRVDEVIDLLIKGLNEQDRRLYTEQQLFNMDDVERLQEVIYEWYLSSEI